jgi:hypothetical protein
MYIYVMQRDRRCIHAYSVFVCVCVCVRERERERRHNARPEERQALVELLSYHLSKRLSCHLIMSRDKKKAGGYKSREHPHESKKTGMRVCVRARAREREREDGDEWR